MENCHLVFVYGTLRKFQNHSHLLDTAVLVASQCWTSGKLYDSSYGYPFMVQANDRVYGELYQLDSEQLKMVDDLEDYQGPGQDNLYERVEQTIFSDSGTWQAFVYVLPKSKNKDSLSLIKEGDWSVYRLLKDHDRLLYFAYGSCMDMQSFKKAKKEHYFQQVIGRGILDGFTLRYTRVLSDGGRADIVEEGGKVEGKVYQISSQAVSYLHEREGVKYNSYRPAIVPVKLDNHMIKEALTYIVVKKEREVAPPVYYMDSILRGGTGFLSPAYLNKLKEQYKLLLNNKV
ncbi:gamma-glutamylcyclotransferase [Bacillus benzoevorans]|uniref:Gamma-glutamylcyclotransferase (GGCT)/AIG2-like uncharacterized protein YtfP n=1 Tax=Bacillus benzoevorans TaxID=1456 RepID=A0A7X0LU02_9BACI|nr:gamma-glutamylcyclotransferase family protein [Bacillus benzoevorans]MBB6443950.1 gamma-glutamylcyclotransferase (GGCT)/AIG2-like uncharacterized protein YtfP [Bacillus benzoevorans]